MTSPPGDTLEHVLRNTRELASGSVVAGRFEIVKRIGKGGSGSVYLCKDRKLGRLQVALKVIDPDFLGASQGRSKRIELEILAAHRVDSNHVARIYEVILDQGLVAYTAEYVAGLDLRQYQKEEGKIALPMLKLIMMQTCAGLRAIHAQSIIHRDIKPENIILTEDAFVKLVDFGIARVLDNSPDRVTQTRELHVDIYKKELQATSERITADGAIVGTLEFLAPEYFLKGDGDYRSDLYSLGITFLELLIGKNPYYGMSENQVIRSKLGDSSHLFEYLPADLPEKWQAAFRKLLDESPERRYQNIEAFIEDLRTLPAPESGNGDLPVTASDPLPLSRTLRSLISKAAGSIPPSAPRSPVETGLATNFEKRISRRGTRLLSDFEPVLGLLRFLAATAIVVAIGAAAYQELRSGGDKKNRALPPVLDAGRSISPTSHAETSKSKVHITARGNDITVTTEDAPTQ